MRLPRPLILLSAVLAAAGLPGRGLAAEATNVAHVDGRPTMDGKLDEALWQQATRFELPYETNPGENTPASVKTTVYMAENGTHLLLAFVAEDPDPSQIRAYLRDRDSAWDDDFVGVVLDTFDDQRRAYEIFANPLGAQMDLIIEEQSGNEDESWDGLWESAGNINATGYIVEFEIPFSTLRFQNSQQAQQWGIDVLRFRPRDNRYRMSNNVRDRNNRCYSCGFAKFRGFAGAEAGKNLEIAPTLTMSYAQERPSAGVPFTSEGIKFDPGLDVKWGPSPNLTLNATLNPDFSQVETDEAELDVNNTFALFFPEKRPFFLEGADYFSTPNDLVYTRNVTDPDIGLRATGRSGQQTYGVFVARDTVTNLLKPGVYGSRLARYDIASNDAALRYRYDLAGNSSVGVLATERRGDDYTNSLQAVDGRWQHDKHSIEAQYMQSRTQDPGEAGIEGNAYYAEYMYRSREWTGFAGRNHFDDGFRADLGFIGQVGYEKDFGGLTRHWWGDKGDFFNHITVNGRWNESRTSDGTLIELVRESWVGANAARQSYIEFGHVERDRIWRGVRFDERINRIYGSIKPVRGVSLELFTRHGSKVDLANVRMGKITTIQPSANFNLGRSLTLSVDHNYERLSRDGGDVYVANLTDLRLSWQFDLRQRIRLAVVRSDVKLDPSLFTDPVPERQRAIGTQLIYSYKVNPRTALYAGYADGYEGDEFQPMYQRARALFFKVGYAWER
ncbi:carbohydrate binding family 9 domain-containing protein [Arenimonas oryziterrae]|uniref:Uncharacterized protein n=1 Tax=Arenimonas oryziterrae DSM 21050 = YC6267 TaxID=1121015 RepID=A0A091BI53_9GAMM|nr:carbohydrate binding family 9 domain-containing protein [Arenimonas oryziterrae]KFN44030.1 hypothetical protein N789_06345 [Arenimonas oryziterrae DSM 21050 = YC6267]